ncbi:aquaporin [Fulvivirgaceae bacterium BMA10]|uniref:Aquaporin n=1 Tax=Splendidivirga corallicola TaxID=3051826 RepID=A0ABT8KXL4_9BACT|nr:aquaporin [Fulvivirgaceae bacterium BMA10]
MKKLLAELIGTYALVFCGTGAIVINDITNGSVSHVGIAVTFGLIVMAMIYAFGDISGAHINPAVTIAFWFSGRFSPKLVIPYIIAQLAGGLLASLSLKLLFPIHETLGATLPVGTNMQSFVLEVILTFFLMLVIINVSTGSKETGTMAGIAIGAVVLLEAMFAGPVSGASMNPARSIAPALISGNLQHLWVYLLAPVLGASLAILGCRGVKQKDCCPVPSPFCKPVKD